MMEGMRNLRLSPQKHDRRGNGVITVAFRQVIQAHPLLPDSRLESSLNC